MKRILWLIIGMLICVSVVLFIVVNNITIAQEEATPTPNYSYITVEAARVRAAPSETSLSIGTLLKNARLMPYNRDESGNWVLVDYAGGFGWVRRDLAFWVENIDALPILTADNLTPTPVPRTPSPTPRLVTLTPVGSYVIARVNVYVRTGPGLSFTPLGILRPGDVVEPLNIDETGTWVLIRYSYTQRNIGDDVSPTRVIDGFGWIARNVVLWTVNINQLPILYDDALTPTSTFTPSFTPSLTPSATTTEMVTLTSTLTNTPTVTITDTPTLTNTPTKTSTFMPTLTPTATHTAVPSDTPTLTPTATHTAVPSDTPTLTPTATHTAIPSDTPTATHTALPSPTPTPTVTFTDVPTQTPTLSGQATAIDELSPTSPPSVVGTEVIGVLLASETPTPEIVVAQNPTEIPPTVVPIDEPPTTATPIPLEAVVAGVALFVILTYVWMYWRGQSAVERYATGFIIQKCPVCRVGNLEVETRTIRILGIPRPRRTIRCDNCRSLLREVAANRWRYAVDKLANVAMYDRYNGLEVDERTLLKLSQHPTSED